jgi:diguanylate cyclase (GGDEF)-like protein
MRSGELALQLCRRQTGHLSLLYFDLNGFKQINDQHGHHEGDQALIQFAKILVQSARRSDLVARLGGDEFAMLALSTNTPQITPLLRRLREALAAYNLRSGKPYSIRYSVGCVSREVDQTTTLDELLIEADARMYAQKTRNAKKEK